MRLNKKIDTSGGYRIKWMSDQWWVIGNGIATACGSSYSGAKYVLEGMTETPPIWEIEPRMTEVYVEEV